jgi:hypothetical protein
VRGLDPALIRYARLVRAAVLVLILGPAACAAAGPRSPVNRCTESRPAAGAPSAFTTAGNDVDGVHVTGLFECPGEPTETRYVTLDVGPSTRRLRLAGGVIRCEDGVFRTVEGHHPICDLAQPEAPPEAPAFADAFFREVSLSWAKAGIELRGIGVLACKSGEPMIALGDYAGADRAAALLIEHARAWGLGGTVNLVVRGTRGSCPES